MKKLIPAAISIFLVCNAYAASWSGWNTNAWPSTNHYRWTNGNVTVDMVAEQRTLDDLFFINTGKALFGASVGSLIPGWNTNGYESEAVGPDAASAVRGTLYVPAYAAANSNYFNITNVVTYYRGIALGTNPPAANTNISSYSWDAGNPFSDPVYYQTNTVTWTGVATQLYAQVKDLWGIDGYLALTDASKIGAYDAARSTFATNAVTAPIPYRNNRAALVNLKTWLSNNVQYFCDPSLDDDGVTNLLNTVGSTAWTATGLYASVSAPTNWGDYTPWRDLGGNVAGQSAVVTNSYLCPTAGTYIVVDYWGGTNNSITATAAQETVTLLTTNATILAGFTTADYGYKYLPDILSKLTRTRGVVNESYVNLSNTTAIISSDDTFSVAAAGFDTAINAAWPPTGTAYWNKPFLYVIAEDDGPAASPRWQVTSIFGNERGDVRIKVPQPLTTGDVVRLYATFTATSPTYYDLAQAYPSTGVWYKVGNAFETNGYTADVPYFATIPANFTAGIPQPTGATNQYVQEPALTEYLIDWDTNGLPYSTLP